MTGWERKKLGEVCELVARGVAPRYIDDDGLCVLNQKCVRDHVIDYRLSRRHDISKKSVDPERLIRVGDVLVNSTGTGTLGRVAQVREIPSEPATVDTHVTIVRPQSDRFFLDFFGYMMIMIEEEIAASGEGASGQTELARSTLANEFDVNFPTSKQEQQRIVAILDEAFEGLAVAAAGAEKNLRNARELFDSYLNSVFAQKGEGWVDRQLASLCHEITVGHVGSMKAEYKESGIPFLRSQNIRPFEVSMENVMFIDDTFHRALKKSQLRPGDLAIVRTGYPGTAAVIPPELPDSNCSDLVIVRPTKEVNPHFLAAFFNSAFGKQLVLGKIVGAAQKHFNVTAAKEVMLHLPPVAEQLNIIRMGGSLREETQRLARLYERKLAALETLKKSLLHQAFAGKLTSSERVAA